MKEKIDLLCQYSYGKLTKQMVQTLFCWNNDKLKRWIVYNTYSTANIVCIV